MTIATCIQHIVPANNPPWHDVQFCRCLTGESAIIVRHKVVSGMRFQPEFFGVKWPKLEAWAANRKAR